MRYALALTAATFLAWGSPAAATHPDFSGTWRIDVEKTAGASATRTDTWIVSQTSDTLTLVDANLPDEPRVYKLDGSPTEGFNILTGRWVYRTLWIGDRLLIMSEGEDPAAASTEIWSLDHGALAIEWQRPRARTLVNYYKRVQ